MEETTQKSDVPNGALVVIADPVELSVTVGVKRNDGTIDPLPQVRVDVFQDGNQWSWCWSCVADWIVQNNAPVGPSRNLNTAAEALGDAVWDLGALVRTVRGIVED